MYPEITPLVRDAIKRRYEILPYIYSLGLESHLTASPPQRWIGWGYESDPEVWTKALKSEKNSSGSVTRSSSEACTSLV